MKSKVTKIQFFKKGMAILLVLMFLTTPVAYATTSLDDGYLEGSWLDKIIYGTVGSTAKEIEKYLKDHTTLYIANETQLRALAEYVNKGNTCEGKEIILLNDIKLNSNEEWNPIGSEEKRFEGTFNGNNFSISGITYIKRKDNTGFFKIVGEKAKVKNLTISDSDISLSDKDIVGSIAEINYGSIKNCINNNNIIGGIEVGGIVGNNYGEVIECINNATIEGDTSVGGIVGYNIETGIVKNCINNGEIKGTNDTSMAIGGITGRTSGKIEYCINNGKISSNYVYAGGIAGAVKTKIENCINYGEVIAKSYGAGGIAGLADSDGDFSDAFNSDTDTNMIRYCLNTRSIKSNSSAGGIVGRSKDYKISNSYNESKIEYISKDEDNSYFGGIVGEAKNTIIEKCINDGAITGLTFVGGISGLINNVKINQCINSENISTYNSGAQILGGIVGGIIGKGTIYSCMNSGDVTGAQYLGGIIGVIDPSASSNTRIIDCINEGLPTDKMVYSPNDFEVTYTVSKANANTRLSALHMAMNVIKAALPMRIKQNLEKSTIKDTIDQKTETNISYKIKINNKDISELDSNHIKAGDTINVTATFNKYLAKYFGPLTAITEAPALKLNNKIQMEAKSITANQSDYTTTIEYAYTVKANDNIVVTNLNLYESGKMYVISDSNYVTNHPEINSINKTTAISNIYIDTVAPLIDTKVYVENALETGRYTAGKEILIEVKTNEPIQDKYENMEIQVNFSESGIGKYNYTQNAGMAATVGHAKCKDAKINIDGTTTWIYSYQIQEGDEGNIYLTYIKGQIKDLAGNQTNIPEKINLPSATHGDNKNITNITINKDRNFILDYELYKNGIKLTNFDEITKLETNDTLEVKAIFNKGMYTAYGNTASGTSNIKKVDKETAPTLKLNNSISMECSTVNVTDNKKTVIEYIYKVKKDVEIQKISTLDMMRPAYYCTDSEQTIQNTNDSNKNNVLVNAGNINQNITDLNLVIDTIGAKIDIENIYADTTRPTLEIRNINIIGKTDYDFDENGYTDGNDVRKLLDYADGHKLSANLERNIKAHGDIDKDGKITSADARNLLQILSKNTSVINTDITNADIINYQIIFSERVEGFTKEDITVVNGVIEEDGFIELASGREYTVRVKSSIQDGDQGILKVIVEDGACQDLVGRENVRTESIIRVDKQAPILIGLEAYGTSNIALNKEIDVVKENYKLGETITVIATFDENITSLEENITGLPQLALQFSKSGNAKGTVNSRLEGNKIIYTYTIAKGDEGTLSVKGFTGTVVDSAGNETKVTKRTLDGDTIIADTTAPTLNELKVTTAEGTYKAGTTIQVEAIYSEDIYALENNEIKNITSTIAPTLKFKFVNGEEREAVAAGYGTKEDGTPDKTKIIYTCTIIDGDNGDFNITSYENKENVKICDIAGNEANLVKNQTGNKVTADTIRPQVTNITASVENPIIAGTGIYHKEGNNIKVTLTFNEEVSSAVLLPKILVGFSEAETEEPASYSEYSYESDWNVNSTTIEYTYTIKSGDNGYLWVKVPEGQFRDIAGNTNIEKEATKVSNIFADTTAPTVTLLRDTEIDQENQTITIKATFSENVYDLNNNSIVTLTKENAPKLIYSFGTGANQEANASDDIKGSVITYVIKKDPVNDNGTLHYELAKGNLCDRAGNEYYQEKTDTTAPELERVYISNNGTHGIYCKKDVNMCITAVFNEEIASANMKLKVKLGEGEEKELTGKINEANKKEAVFTYTVQENDNGKLTIIDVTGNVANDDELEDKTYGYVKDTVGNQKNIFNLNGVRIDGEAIADTIKPYVTNISAKVGEKEIAKYQVTENGIETTVGKTNVETIEYIITFSETVTGFTKEDITLANGTIKEFEPIINTEGKQYKLTVYNTFEGIQSLIIPENICEDVAGNENTGARLNGVIIDFTPATVRFISEYNGGTYVLPTNIGKVEIRPNVEINEEISKIEYKWDEEEYATVENISSASDITIPTKAFTESGTHTLYIKVVDIAGNVTEINKTYEIINSYITITPSTTDDTKEDIKVTVNFGEGLTDNRKVTFKAKDSNEVIELNASGNSDKGTEYIIETNGIVYAEATDRVGNKVYTEYIVYNIDKEAPEIEFNYITTEVLTNVSVDTTISTNEDAKISYKWDNEEWQTTPEYTMNVKVGTKFAGPGEHTLYAKAIDKCGNETFENSLRFYVSAISFEVYGNPENWTSKDVELQVNCDAELTSVKVLNGEQEIAVDENQTCIITENGDYVFTVTDKNGNIATKTIKVTKIDKKAPVITSATNEGKVITINSTDAESGVAKYAITSTTEVPVEWSNSNVISTTKDGTYYVWAIDNVGNVVRAEEAITIDTTAPIITYRYTSLTSILGKLLESDIITNEDAVIFYSWDNQNWTSSEKYVTNVKASIKAENVGTYTLYVKAKDRFGNESDVQTLEFTVTKPTEEMKNSEIIFEDLPTIQVDGVKYVKVAADMTTKDITAKMNKDKLLGENPEYTELTKDNKLRTGSKISIKDETQYIIIVNGDVNCDGKVTPIDVTMANSIRLNKISSNIIQKLASDFDLNGKIGAIDITMINSYRLGKIKGI